jgi:molybdopterin-binding protein
MKLSARNILKGKVKKVVHGAVNSEVTVALAGGAELVSIITKQSSKNLNCERNRFRRREDFERYPRVSYAIRAHGDHRTWLAIVLLGGPSQSSWIPHTFLSMKKSAILTDIPF